MVFLIDFTEFASFFLQPTPEPPEVKYNVAYIAAAASVTAALISAAMGVFTIFMSRKTQSRLQAQQAALTSQNQKELAELQSKLTLHTQTELGKANAKLTQETQESLESLKAELSARNLEQLELLRAKLGEQGRERDARRDYEYEAQNRLYTQCEPLLFQLADLAEHGYYRVCSLARSSRLGNIPYWLEGDGYYLRSTIYRLLAPLVIFRLIQQRLTFIDLKLDAYIANQYRLLKLLYLTFTDPFEFASIEPRLDYRPDVEDWNTQREANPQTHWRQGLYLGSLDNAIDALLVMQEGQAPRLKTYGEFELEFEDQKSDTFKRLATFADVLYRFHPRTRPVLWRMLYTQTLIYQKILESQSAAGAKSSRSSFPSVVFNLPNRDLDWRQDESEASVEESLMVPKKVAEEYLRRRLPDVFAANP